MAGSQTTTLADVLARKAYLRPVTVAVTFTFLGEMLILWIWGMNLFSDGAFGAHDAPLLFVFGGLVPAFLSAFIYAWLLYAPAGRSVLDRIGY